MFWPIALVLTAAPPSALGTALSASRARSDSRVELTVPAQETPNCRANAWTPLRPIDTSGVIPVRVSGRDGHGHACLAVVRVGVRVFAPVAVAAFAISAGSEITATVEERELVAGRSCLPSLTEPARARRSLRAGECIESGFLEFGPRPGSPVQVRLSVGSLTVERPGRALSSDRTEGSAQLPDGRRVSGRWDGTTLEVLSP